MDNNNDNMKENDDDNDNDHMKENDDNNNNNTNDDDGLMYKLANEIFESPKNLSTKEELYMAGRVALKAFKDNDYDGSGELDFNEMKRLCLEMGLQMSNNEEEELAKIDKDGSDALNLNEWLSWWLLRVSCLPNPGKQQEAIARNTFKKFDKDGSRNIDKKEFELLLDALGASFSIDEIAMALKELDTDQTGDINEDEFVQWWTNRAINNRKSGAAGLIALKMRKLANRAAQIFFTDIFTATWSGDIELVKIFLDSEIRTADASDESEYGGGWTPLQYASYQGHLAIVEELLKVTKQVDKRNNYGFTALFYAAQRSQVEICKLLIDAGADPTIVGVDPNTDDKWSCPAEFAADLPELNDLFVLHERCGPPESIRVNDIKNAKISHSVLSLELPLQRTISKLPLISWEIEIHIETNDNNNNNETKEPELDCDSKEIGNGSKVFKLVAALTTPPPQTLEKEAQTLTIPLSKFWWYKSLRDGGYIEPKISITLTATNIMKIKGSTSDKIPIEYIPQKTQSSKVLDDDVKDDKDYKLDANQEKQINELLDDYNVKKDFIPSEEK